MRTTIRVKLVAAVENLYSTYVFQNLEEKETSLYRYITVTKCPNWMFFETLKIGDIGYLEYEFAKAGGEYFDPSTETIKQYKYTANYFINFIKETKDIRDEKKEFKF